MSTKQTGPKTTSTTSRLEDWGADGPRGSIVDLVAIEAGIALVAGSIVAVITDVVIGGGVGLLMLMATQLRVVTGGKQLLRSVAARPLRPEDGARLPNITEGLCSDLGVPPPSLWVIDEGGPNAFVTWSGGGHLAVTTSLLAGATRTETEAVVAFCLVRLVSLEARRTTYQVATGLPAREKVGRRIDIAAAALTRYPPALVASLRKAVPRQGRTARLWMVGDESTHEPTEQRVAELADL